MIFTSNRNGFRGNRVCLYQDITPSGQKIRELLMVAAVIWLLLVAATARGEGWTPRIDHSLGFSREAMRE